MGKNGLDTTCSLFSDFTKDLWKPYRDFVRFRVE
jgi:hypothetical protein